MSNSKAITKQEPARVLIVDDHPIVREGLAIQLSREVDLEFCGEADDVPEAIKLVQSTNPDVVIVDIVLKSGNGIDLVKRIRDNYSRVRMLVWSMYNDLLYCERALRAGALGYVSKEQATVCIIEAIRQVLADQVYLSEPMAARLLKRTVGGTRRPQGALLMDSLSDRELEAFQLIGQGLDAHQVARKMNVSAKTVDTYRSRIKRKLRIDSGHQLIRTAVQWVIDGAR